MAITEFDRSKLVDPLGEIYQKIELNLLNPIFEHLPKDKDGYRWHLNGFATFISFKSIDPQNSWRVIEITSTGPGIVILRWQGRLSDPTPKQINDLVDTQIYIKASDGEAWNLPYQNHLHPTMDPNRSRSRTKKPLSSSQ